MEPYDADLDLRDDVRSMGDWEEDTTAGTPTLPPPPAEPPDAAFLEEMAKDLAGYGTKVVGPPGPPERR